MGNTYSQLSVQAVFAVRNRGNFILDPWRDELHKYISGILKANGATSLAVGGWRDHVHLFFGLQVTTSIAELIGAVKANSSRWINERKLVPGRFEWQSGYGAFSYSRGQRDMVINYIMNQESQHSTISFRQEYLKLLHEFDINYNEKYLFNFFD